MSSNYTKFVFISVSITNEQHCYIFHFDWLFRVCELMVRILCPFFYLVTCLFLPSYVWVKREEVGVVGYGLQLHCDVFYFLKKGTVAFGYRIAPLPSILLFTG